MGHYLWPQNDTPGQLLWQSQVHDLWYSACNHSVCIVCTQWLHPFLVSQPLLVSMFCFYYTQYTYFPVTGIFSVTDTPWYHAAQIREVLL